jgi:hypothetical protein
MGLSWAVCSALMDITPIEELAMLLVELKVDLLTVVLTIQRRK